MKKIYLVDVSSMYFRAFYAIRPLSNKSGMPTNALFGFLSMCVKLLKDVRPDYMVFCFDRKEPSFRKDIYSDYKANRSEMPEDLIPQVPFVRKISESLGIKCIDMKGYEADDLIGSICEFGRKQNLEVIIVSGDKDFAQLVNQFVTIYDTMKETHYNVDGVIEKWGVHPEQIIDYLSLVGDSSDNIPGVSGIGPKGAQKLIAEFKTLENIYENLEKIKNENLKKKLIADKEKAFLSKQLVAIKTDIDLNLKLDELKLRPIVESELKSLLDELDFKSFERKIFGTNSSVTENNSTNNEFSESLAIATPISISESSETAVNPPARQSAFEYEAVEYNNDLEINSNNARELISKCDSVWGMKTERGDFIGIEKKVYRVSGDLTLLSDQINKIDPLWKGYDLKSFWHQLNLAKPRAILDSQVAAYVVRAGEVGEFRDAYLKFTGKALPELASASQVYAANIEFATIVQERLKEINAYELYMNYDLPLVAILYRMEQKGVLIDTDKLKIQSNELEKEIHELEKKIFEITGHTFNLGSTKQLAEVLFTKLKMPTIRKTKTGFSTDSDVLTKLSVDYPVCNFILEYREITKLKSTYVDSLPALIHPIDKRIHTRFNQSLTTTGRLSSTNPNLQNIPIRTPRGARIREAFVVPEGYQMISADYSQIELRVLAHITEDSGLMEAFDKDLDIHSATASEVFEIKLKDVTPEQRRVAKAVNFGIAYGMGAFGLSENLSISVDEANGIIKKYFVRFPKVREYMDSTIESAKQNGYVETIFGRRRYIDELKSKNGTIRKFGERAAINAPIQGTASDIVKKAMIDIDNFLPDTMIMQVHDELVFEVPNQLVSQNMSLIKKTMENVVKLKVPLKVNVLSGSDWDSAH